MVISTSNLVQGNIQREVRNTWHTFYVSRSTRPEVQIWRTFSLCED